MYQLDRHFFMLGSTAEREDLLDQCTAPLACQVNFKRIVVLQAIGREILHQHLRHPDDGGQNIVKVVGNATGQISDGFHFLRLPESFLVSLFICNVLNDDQPQIPQHNHMELTVSLRTALDGDIPFLDLGIAFIGAGLFEFRFPCLPDGFPIHRIRKRDIPPLFHGFQIIKGIPKKLGELFV